MTKLYIGNINYKTKEEDLKKHFGTFGKVKECKLMEFRGYSRGFAFVEYETEEEAKKGVTSNGTEFEGRKLKVEIARPKEERKTQPKEVKKTEKKEEKKPQGNRPRGYNQGRRGNFRRGPRRNYNYNANTYRKRPNQQKKEKDNKPKEESTNTIFVKNLKFECTDKQLEELFKDFNVVSAKIITRKTRNGERSKGFGFVEVKTAEDQNKAIEKLNNTQHMERQISVSKAFKRPEVAEKK